MEKGIIFSLKTIIDGFSDQNNVSVKEYWVLTFKLNSARILSETNFIFAFSDEKDLIRLHSFLITWERIECVDT